MTRKVRVWPVTRFAAAAGLVVFVGCGSDDTSTRQATPTGTTVAAAAVPRELVGTWKGRPRNWRKADPSNRAAQRLQERVAVGRPPGYYTMKLAEDGTVEMYDPGVSTAQGCLAHCDGLQLKASDGKLIIGDTLECVTSAVYSYKVEGDKLTTKRVEDDCTLDRRQLFDGSTWRRQS